MKLFYVEERQTVLAKNLERHRFQCSAKFLNGNSGAHHDPFTNIFSRISHRVKDACSIDWHSLRPFSIEVNHAFISIKLWLLLAQKCTNAIGTSDPFAEPAERSAEDRSVSMVWNELWPPFERLVSLFEIDLEEETPEGSVSVNRQSDPIMQKH